MNVEWENTGRGEYLCIDRELQGYMSHEEWRFAYHSSAGVLTENVPEGLTIDEAKAWALTIYRMAQ